MEKARKEIEELRAKIKEYENKILNFSSEERVGKLLEEKKAEGLNAD